MLFRKEISYEGKQSSGAFCDFEMGAARAVERPRATKRNVFKVPDRYLSQHHQDSLSKKTKSKDATIDQG